MIRYTTFTIIAEPLRRFKDISPKIQNYLNSIGTSHPIGTGQGDVLSFKLNLNKNSKYPLIDGRQKIDNAVCSSEIEVSLCKHGFLVVEIKNEKIEYTTPEMKEFFHDQASIITCAIQNKESLRLYNDNNETKSAISPDTGFLYINQDISDIFADHMYNIEKRYSKIILNDLFAQCVLTEQLEHQRKFADSFNKIKDAFYMYSNKLTFSPDSCSLIRMPKSNISQTVDFVRKLCSNMDERFNRLSTYVEMHNTKELYEIFNTDIEKLVVGSETQCVEFKATAKYDLAQKKPTNIPGDEIRRTVCGFMNSFDGGVLIVGIHERGDDKYMGIEADYKHVGSSKDWDAWDRYFRDVCDKIQGDGVKGAFNHLIKEIMPVKHRKVTLAKILVFPSSGPAFIENDFFARNGPSTKKLDGARRQNYIKKRFYAKTT